jgi:DNA-binding transcriptional MerR regulator
MAARLVAVPATVDATPDDGLTVGAAAAAVGVTVRTLHHWDRIGLVSPSGRTVAGYRLYSAGDLARIHRVLIYRELGLPLDSIGKILDFPGSDPGPCLRQQRALLAERLTRLQGMVEAVDRFIAAHEAGTTLTPAEQVAIFGRDWQPSWSAQARQQWGQTEQWVQYAERAATMTAGDWQQTTSATTAVNSDLAAAVRAGIDPASTQAGILAERHRATIGAYFDCTHSRHACLGRLYLADARFTAYYEALQPGLTQWLHDAIDANAARNGIDPHSATWQ